MLLVCSFRVVGEAGWHWGRVLGWFLVHAAAGYKTWWMVVVLVQVVLILPVDAINKDNFIFHCHFCMVYCRCSNKIRG